MHLTHALGLRRRPLPAREGAVRRPHRPSAPPRAAAPRGRHDGPQDVALYTCACGFAWTGRVTTSVACPHCGAGQAW